MIDLNVESLKTADIEWGDMVFATAMLVQKDSLKQVVRRSDWPQWDSTFES